MNLGVDGVAGRVDAPLALHYHPVVVDQEQIADPDAPERLAESVDPEVIRAQGVTCGDVATGTVGESEPREEAKCRGELLLSVQLLG